MQIWYGTLLNHRKSCILLEKFEQESHFSREQEKTAFKASQEKILQKGGLRNLLL